MKRTKFNFQVNAEQRRRIQTLESIVLQGSILSRSSALSRLGLQYDGDRNIYQALGYPTTLEYVDYVARYTRQDIAKAIINRPVEATWRGPVEILETDDEKVTGLEKAWLDLMRKLSLKSAFVRLDKLACLGRWGALMLGFDDTNGSEALSKPIAKGKRTLLYVKPLSESSARINQWVTDPSNERYGLPLTYSVTTSAPGGGSTGQVIVHYTRMIHVPGELHESEIEGMPVMQPVFNRLIDLEKLVGASAEMFWRGARPGYHGKIAEGFQLTDTTKEDLQTQIDEYEHNLRRFLVNEGLDLTPLAMQVADPSHHFDVQIQTISAVTGIPKRILIGSERGELASSEDRTAWLETIQSRREDYAEIQILHPFIERCQEYGVLPKSKNIYKIIWSDIFAPSEKERAEIGKTRASALQSYMNNPAAEIVVPPEVFYEYMLGLSMDDVEHIKNLHMSSIAEDLNQMRDQLANQPKNGGGRQPSSGQMDEPTVQEELAPAS